jgi:uncharacterized protein YecE (DUF72 family)
MPQTITEAMLIYGTASFSEKSWVGSFYPEGAAPRDFLGLYAARFRIPRASMLQGWVQKTPDEFRICAKFPRTIVHAGEGRRPDPEKILTGEEARRETDEFLEVMRLLGKKCGPLVLQFPFFARDLIARGEFLERLDQYLGGLPKDFRYGVELRNRGFVCDPLLHILRRHAAAFVATELPYMPHPSELAGEFDLVTTDFFYGRLIGDRKAVDDKTKTFDRIVIDRSDSLARWAELLQGVRGRVEDVYVFANNHFAGHGPATIRDLVARLGE